MGRLPRRIWRDGGKEGGGLKPALRSIGWRWRGGTGGASGGDIWGQKMRWLGRKEGDCDGHKFGLVIARGLR